jgi:hypothetical protein
MEAAGLMNTFPRVVIRGISDYVVWREWVSRRTGREGKSVARAKVKTTPEKETRKERP